MTRYFRSTVRIRCPGGDGQCEAKLTVTIDPPEKRTWDYPGCPAMIDTVEGCEEHVPSLSDTQLWAAIDEVMEG